MSDKEKAAEEHANKVCPESGPEFVVWNMSRQDFLAGAEWATPRWIKCSERVPEESGKYLVIRFNGDNGSNLGWKAEFGGWNINSEGGRSTELFPTHWMPLPEAPKEEES